MKRLPMRKIRDALRLRANGLSMREIAASLGVGQSTLSDYLKRAARAGLVWPLPEALTDAALEAMLFQPMGGVTRRVQAQPDWPMIHRELRRKDVTLALLWEEYRAAHPDGYGYSRFCELYRRWEGRLAPTMRQHHVAGERMFVDYAGATLAVIDAATGKVRQAQLFVAALGASNYTVRRGDLDAEPARLDRRRTAGRSAWFGGVPAQIVSDNLKAGVTKACFYEPAVNRTYADMAAHYDTAVVPARPRQAARQGQGRGRRPGGAALDRGAAAQPAVLLARRAERGDPRAGRRAQRRASPATSAPAAGSCSRSSSARR